MDNVTTDTNDQQTDMGAGQPSLFPEEGQGAAGSLVPTLSQQLGTMSPDDISHLAQALDPDVRSVLANALFAAMKPEDKQMADTTPGADVSANMADATPEKPEQQYQMSIVRQQKRCETQPGMAALAEDHLARWNDRVDSLIEDGYMDEATSTKLKTAFDKKGQNRFSIILEDRGLLRDACTEVEALERARSCGATLNKSVLDRRFGTSAPRLPGKIKEKEDASGLSFDRKAAEEAGTRLARMN